VQGRVETPVKRRRRKVSRARWHNALIPANQRGGHPMHVCTRTLMGQRVITKFYKSQFSAITDLR